MTAEPHLRPSTAHGYRDHIHRYLIPGIGRITLADLTGKRRQPCLNQLAGQRTKEAAEGREFPQSDPRDSRVLARSRCRY
jgi:hypothetical protein